MTLNWPAVGVTLGIVAIVVFYKPLVRLIDRTRKVGPGGLEAQVTGTESKDSPADDLLKIFDNALLVGLRMIVALPLPDG